MTTTLPGVQIEKVFRMDNYVLPILASMESNGMPVDPIELSRLGQHLQQEIDQLRFQIVPYAWDGFSPGSPLQVADLLFNKLQLPTGKKTKGGDRFTTDDKALDKLKNKHPVVPLLQLFREVQLLKGTFVDGILSSMSPEHRLHTHLNHASVVSGRLSSSDPNMQNIPTGSERGKKIRQAFRVKEGRRLGVYDLSQIELRVLADFSQDPVMCDAFRRGQDLHLKTAAEISGTPYEQVTKSHPLRYPSKRFNFGMAYGISDEGLLDQLKMEGINWAIEEVAKFRREWFRVYAGVQPAMEIVWAYTRKHGYVVDFWGRPRMLPGIWSDVPRIRSESERQAFNHVIQGGAAGIIKMIMHRLWTETSAMEKRLMTPLMWLLQVHDELLLEFPAWGKEIEQAIEEWVLEAMKTTVQLSIPIFGDGKVVQAWGEAK